MEHFKIENDTDLDDLERFISEGHDSRHSENNNDYDLLQQAIISNNSMAVSFILMKDVISPNEHPSCNDYLHLACKLGRASMVKKIVESRPGDLNRVGKVCYPNKCFHDRSQKPAPSAQIIGQLPLDVIVANNQTSCLTALLSSIPHPKHNNQVPAEYLCDINHPQALSLLLKCGVSYGDLKLAYKRALMKKRHRCLELVLDRGFKDLFIHGMNAYHAIYQYSSGLNRHLNRHDGLAATTSCLIKYGADVSISSPAGSYPLYSLIDMIVKDVTAYGEEYLSDSVSKELISTLQLILKQGVRLDLNEVQVSLKRTDENEPVAFGRELFTSVFDALSSNAANALGINLAASEVIKEMVTILMRQSQRVPLRPSHLSGLIKLLVRSRNSKSTCRNLLEVIQTYLREGLDPGIPIQLPFGVGCSSMTTYALNQYVEALCEINNQQSAVKQTRNDNPLLKWLTNLMTYNSLCRANQINYRIISMSANDSLSTTLIRYVTQPPLLRLKTLAARVIWFSVSRQKERAAQLPLPKHMKNSLLDIIIKEL